MHSAPAGGNCEIEEKWMKKMLTLILLSAGIQAASAQKGRCTNPGLEWTINPTYVDGMTHNAIQGDGSPYVDGQSGVSAVINVCSGSTDATLQLSKPRVLSFSLARLQASNSYTPSWALSGNTETGTGFLNVRNLFFVPSGHTRDDEYTFSTRFGSNPPASGSPAFRMLNPSPDAPPSGTADDVVLANHPYPNSLIIVHHCPANANTATCPNITAETWFAYPDPNPTATGTGQMGFPITQVGTLITTSNGTNLNAGEFSMTFLFTISLLP
jgi:hypothetical protein